MLILRCQEQVQATVIGVLFQSLLDIRDSLVEYKQTLFDGLRGFGTE
jgi:hypothetical protein